VTNINELIQEDEGVSQESTLELLSKLSYEQKQKEDELNQLQLQVSQKEEELNNIKRKEIPKVMNDLGIFDFTLKTGESITIKKSYYGSIKGNEEQFYQYLEEHELDDIVKNIITVTFSKEDYYRAKELYENLLKMCYDVTNTRNIHASTLKSFFKERIEGLQELKDMYIDEGKIPCTQDEKGWDDFYEFSKNKDRLQDLMFPINLCKIITVEESTIKLPKSKKKKK